MREITRRHLLGKALAVGATAHLSQARVEILSPEDDRFLDELEKASFLFFWEQAEPDSGLVRDRCNVRRQVTSGVASIAATGFGLTALCIGQKNGWVSLRDARERAVTTLRFLA